VPSSPIPPSLLEELRTAVGPDHVLVDPDLTAGFAVDWTGRFRGVAPAVVRPGSTAEVAAATALGPGRDFFPGGGSNLEEAARAIACELSDADLLAFDERLQGHLRKKFKSLVNWCLESGGDPVPLLDAIQQQAAEYLSERLGDAGPAEVFFEHFGGDEQAAHRALAAAVADTTPQVSVRSGSAGAIIALAVPKGAAGNRLFEMIEQALPGERMLRAVSSDDIVFRREFVRVPLTDLAPLTTAGRDAYKSQIESETPPHARNDIKWVLPQKHGP
jgi:hypothetical protein